MIVVVVVAVVVSFVAGAVVARGELGYGCLGIRGRQCGFPYLRLKGSVRFGSDHFTIHGFV